MLTPKLSKSNFLHMNRHDLAARIQDQFLPKVFPNLAAWPPNQFEHCAAPLATDIQISCICWSTNLVVFQVLPQFGFVSLL